MRDSTAGGNGEDGHTVVQSVLEGRREFGSSVDEGNSPVDVDRLLAALSNRRRRFVLYLLAEEPDSSVHRLSERLRELEDATPDQSDRNAFDDHLVSLQHNHLPVLEEAGVVEVDDERDSIAHGPRFSDAAALLEGAFRAMAGRER